MRETIFMAVDKNIEDFWKSLSKKEKSQFLVLSHSFKDACKYNNKGSSGKFVEIPNLKKSYNSNIYEYKSPWDDKNKLSFEFLQVFSRSVADKKYIISSNFGCVTKYKDLVTSWLKFFDNYIIFGD